MFTFLFIMAIVVFAAPLAGLALWLAGVIIWGAVYGILSVITWIFDGIFGM